METSSKAKRVALAAIGFFAKKAIELIPVVGPYIKFTTDLYETVKREWDRETVANEPFPEDELLREGIESLSPQERAEAINSALDSPESQQILRRLSLADQQEFKERLFRMPNEIYSLMSRLDHRDTKLEQEARDREATILEEQVRKLHQDLQSHMSSALLPPDPNVPEELFYTPEKKAGVQYAKALETVGQILVLRPSDPEALKVQIWLESKLKRNLLYDVTAGMGCGAVAVFIIALLGGISGGGGGAGSGDAKAILLIVVVLLGGLVGFIASSYRRFRRWWILRGSKKERSRREEKGTGTVSRPL